MLFEDFPRRNAASAAARQARPHTYWCQSCMIALCKQVSLSQGACSPVEQRQPTRPAVRPIPPARARSLLVFIQKSPLFTVPGGLWAGTVYISKPDAIRQIKYGPFPCHREKPWGLPQWCTGDVLSDVGWKLCGSGVIEHVGAQSTMARLPGFHAGLVRMDDMPMYIRYLLRHGLMHAFA